LTNNNFDVIEEMKLMGVPLIYDKIHNTYCYGSNSGHSGNRKFSMRGSALQNSGVDPKGQFPRFWTQNCIFEVVE